MKPGRGSLLLFLMYRLLTSALPRDAEAIERMRGE
jgi:hypothetical protein